MVVGGSDGGDSRVYSLMKRYPRLDHSSIPLYVDLAMTTQILAIRYETIEWRQSFDFDNAGFVDATGEQNQLVVYFDRAKRPCPPPCRIGWSSDRIKIDGSTC